MKYYTLSDCFNECGDEDYLIHEDENFTSGVIKIKKKAFKNWNFSGDKILSDKWQIKRAEPKVSDDLLIGKTVTVYDRYLFAVPVRGIIMGIARHADKAFQVKFFKDNPGGRNVNKHDGKYFHREQCRIEEETIKGDPKVLSAEEWLTTSWATQKSIKNFGGYNDMVRTYEAGDKNGQNREYYRPEQVELREAVESLVNFFEAWSAEEVQLKRICKALENLKPPVTE